MDEHTLVLAFGIGEYQSALDHLHALEKVECPVPPAVVGRIQRDLEALCGRWNWVHGEALFRREDTERIVREAREFATAHSEQMDELLRRKEEEGEQDEGLGR